MGRVTIDRGKAEAMIRRTGAENLMEEGRRLLAYAQDECPVQTGFLRSTHRLERVSWRRVKLVVTAPYAMEVFDGRGPGGKRRPNRWLLRAIDRARV